MSLNIYWADLNLGMVELARQWEDTRAVWDDAMSQEFQRRYYEPLERNVHAVLEAMNHLGPLLDRARQDCEGPGN